MCLTGGSKVKDAKKTADDATSAVKSVVPDQPQQAAKDAVSSVKDALPGKPEEAAKDAAAAAKNSVPDAPKNPFSNFFGGDLNVAATSCAHLRSLHFSLFIARQSCQQEHCKTALSINTKPLHWYFSHLANPTT